MPEAGAVEAHTALSSPDSSSAGDWQSDDDQLQAVAVVERDDRRDEAQSKGRRMDLDWTEEPEVPYLTTREEVVDDPVHHVLETPSSPFASPSFSDCLADDHGWTDSPLREDPISLPLSPGERSEVSQATSGRDLGA